MQKRRRFTQTSTLEERLGEDIEQLRNQAQKLPPGPELDRIKRRIRQDETAAHISAWLNSPGLQPPKSPA